MTAPMIHKPIIVSAGAAIIGLIIGGILGHYITPLPEAKSKDDIQKIDYYDSVMDNIDYNDFITSKTSNENIRENLRILTEKPHLAGSKNDEILVDLFVERFKSAGFDWVKKVPNNFLLSKPDVNNLNYIRLYENDVEVFKSSPKEPIDDPDFIPAFNAYTPAGKVESDKLVYANFGREEDFQKLKDLGVDVNNTIVIVRYGKLFRGNKIDNAAKGGALGVILYSDPSEIAHDAEKVFPDGWWLPGSGVQRGTALLGDGDPLTPGWPSTDYAYRIDQKDAKFPKIPAQPIGYDDAKIILQKMEGREVQEETWKGKINDVTYKLGPEMIGGFKVEITTNNYLEMVKSYNVIGVIKGQIEPDRYVLVGNHRDAWGYGAADPSSGSAQLLEVVRVYGEMLKEGWRPRRSLVFCSWGAEEYGIIGSTEWVEEHISKLEQRAVAYLNADTCVTGPIFQGRASPLMWDFVKDVAKQVPGIQNNKSTVFMEWEENDKIRFPESKSFPIMKTLGSGSDQAPFAFYGGVPAFDLAFRSDKTKYNISFYPSYHTAFETFEMMSEFMDPQFDIHRGCSLITGLAAKGLADTALLPFDLRLYSAAMVDSLRSLKEKGVEEKVRKIYPYYSYLDAAVHELDDAATVFMQKLENSVLSPMSLRAANDQLMSFEHNFIIPEGLPGRPLVRHAIFAPSQANSYAAAGFPGLSDLVFGYDALLAEDRLARDKQIKRHVSDLTILTHRAIGMLKNFEAFD